MTTRQILGIVGSGLFFLGVFCPIYKLPIIGTGSYLGSEMGWIYMLIAGLCLLFVLLKKYWVLWVTGGIGLGFILISMHRFNAVIENAKAELARDLAGNLFGGFATALMNQASLQWGWIMFLSGGVLTLVSAGMRGKKEGRNDTQN